MQGEKKHIGKIEFISIAIALILSGLSTGVWVALDYTGFTLKGITLLSLVLIYFVTRKYVKAIVNKKEAKEIK